MPSWSIHLAVAKRVNEKLKVEDDSFVYGNLLPDVDKKTKINRYNAHYYNENLPFPTCPKETQIDISEFLKDYSKYITNPLILGYYSHLLTDNFYNNVVYSKHWVQNSDNDIIGIKFRNGKIKKIDIQDKKRLKRKYKHKDFELYGKYLYNKEVLLPNLNSHNILKNISILRGNFLNKELVNDRVEYLKRDFKKFNKLTFKEIIFKHNYSLFSKKELDNLLDECVRYIIDELKKVV